MISLTKIELENLIRRGLVSIRPPEGFSIETLHRRANTEANPELYRKAALARKKRNKEKDSAYQREYYLRKKKPKLELIKAMQNANSEPQ